jgi:hypothetical protein
MCGVLVTVATALGFGFMVSLVGWVGQDMVLVGQGRQGGAQQERTGKGQEGKGR